MLTESYCSSLQGKVSCASKLFKVSINDWKSKEILIELCCQTGIILFLFMTINREKVHFSSPILLAVSCFFLVAVDKC